MNRSFTKYDTLFLYEIVIGVILNQYFAHVPTTIILSLVLIGLTFEILTSHYWTYCEEFRRSFFTIEGSDVSLSAGISWAGVLVICMNISVIILKQFHFAFDVLVVSVVVVGIIGNILETVCCKWGMFTYTKSWVSRMIFFKKEVCLWNVPLLVRVGYFISFGPLCAMILYSIR